MERGENGKGEKSIDGQVCDSWPSVFVCMCERVSVCAKQVSMDNWILLYAWKIRAPPSFVLFLSLLNRTPAHTPHHVNISMPKIERFQANLMAIKADTASNKTVGVARSEQRTAHEYKKEPQQRTHIVVRIIYRY